MALLKNGYVTIAPKVMNTDLLSQIQEQSGAIREKARLAIRNPRARHRDQKLREACSHYEYNQFSKFL